jgi:tetratricopeptide (TPR) repeat protein
MKLVLVLLMLWHGGDDAARKKAATEHFNKGQKLYAAEKWERALEEFKAGYAAYPLPGFLINIGQSYRQLGERKRAITLYQQYLDLQPEDDSLRPQVQRMIDDLEREERVSAESVAAKAEPPRAKKAEAEPAPPPKPKRAEVAAEPPPKPKKLDLAARAPAEPEPALARAPAREEPNDEESSPWYGKWWVWTLVGAAVAGGVAAGIASSSSSSGGTQPGSLGLLDGRR